MATKKIGIIGSGNTKLTAFVAADDADAKKTAQELAGAIGFDAVDAGPLANARLLEPLGYLNIQLGYVLGHGTQVGFKFLESKSGNLQRKAGAS